MSSHNLLPQLFLSDFVQADPGNGKTLAVDRWFAAFPIKTAAPETRTLPAPHKAGLVCAVVLATDGGDLTLTVTGGYDSGGNTTVTLDDAGDFVVFYSVKYGDDYYWRVLGSDGCGLDATVGDLTAASLYVAGQVSQAQPTPAAIADGDTAITSANLASKILTMVATAARAPTVPTGTAMNAVLAVGDSIDWSFINLAAGAYTITVTAATGHTIVGSAAIAQNVTAMFRTKVSAANTAITYRIG